MTDDVRVEVTGDIGRLTLTRPKAINALDLAMVRELTRALEGWRGEPGVRAVVLDGEGDRGFCAGGDVRSIRTSALGDGSWARDFWREEYTLNALVAAFPTPVWSLMHGVTLGGGIGLGAHASHRVVTAGSRLGMPEVTIGMVPDVGGTWLLSRGSGEWGTHLALTGESVGPDEAVAVGLADLVATEQELTVLRTTDDSRDLRVLGTGSPASQPEWVDRCYQGDSAQGVVARLAADPEPDAQQAAETIAAKSPTAVAVTLAALRHARRMFVLEEALLMEYGISCARLSSADLVEGIRAQVVDKDRQPRWDPASLADVTSAEVERHFS